MQYLASKARVLLILLLSLYCSNSLAKYTYENELYTITHEVFQNHQEIYFSGEIMPMTPKDGLKQIKKRLIKNLNVLVMIGNSGGGFERSYKNLGEAIRSVCHTKNKKMNSGCQITTYLKGRCGSACVEFFMYGDNRIASSNSFFGFHRKWILTPNFTINSPEKMAKKYIDRGANKEWLYNNLHIFTDNQVAGTWIRSQDLIPSNIVQYISNSYDFIINYRNSH